MKKILTILIVAFIYGCCPEVPDPCEARVQAVWEEIYLPRMRKCARLGEGPIVTMCQSRIYSEWVEQEKKIREGCNN